MLRAHGWQEREIYEALAERYRTTLGVEIPRRSGARASAREAFLYLLAFGTLASWTFGFGSLVFDLIDGWIADPLFGYSTHGNPGASMASSLAALLVSFPVFLLVSRSVAKEARQQPERMDSSIRKWLTYMALVIAAAVFVGDLITAVTYLLRGELTSRFFAKSAVVLLISGGVFFHYIGGLQRGEVPAGTRGRDRLTGWLSAIAVAMVVTLGFFQLGLPSAQRDLRADRARVRQIYRWTAEIHAYWTQHASQLPQTLDQLPSGSATDAGAPEGYEYQAKQGSRYQLCTTFAKPSERQRPPSKNWTHPAGHHCFALDAMDVPPVDTTIYSGD